MTRSAEPFLGEVATAPRYRFCSVRDEFPGSSGKRFGALIESATDVGFQIEAARVRWADYRWRKRSAR